MNGLVRGISQGTTDTNRIVIPQITPNFSNDHWHGIGGEFDTDFRVKVINRFNQSNTANLEQIVHIFIAVGKTFDNA